MTGARIVELEFTSASLLRILASNHAYFVSRVLHARANTGDGDADVLSVSTNDNKLAWYRNSGPGVFSAPIIISSSQSQPATVAAGRLNSDMHIDVVCSSVGDSTIVWYRNNGSGGFAAQPAITSTLTDALAVFLADFDGTYTYTSLRSCTLACLLALAFLILLGCDCLAMCDCSVAIASLLARLLARFMLACLIARACNIACKLAHSRRWLARLLMLAFSLACFRSLAVARSYARRPACRALR